MLSMSFTLAISLQLLVYFFPFFWEVQDSMEKQKCTTSQVHGKYRRKTLEKRNKKNCSNSQK